MRPRSVVALGAALAACAGACDQATSAVSAMTTQYLGSWQITSGQETSDCGNGSMPPTPLAGAVLVNDSQPPGTLSVRDSNHGTCVWLLNAGPTQATFRSGQQCVTVSGSGMNTSITPRDYTMTLLSSNRATVTSTFVFQALGITCTQMDEENLAFTTTQTQ